MLLSTCLFNVEFPAVTLLILALGNCVQVFEPFGQVELVQLPRDPESGHCKGFGFIQVGVDIYNLQFLNDSYTLLL